MTTLFTENNYQINEDFIKSMYGDKLVCTMQLTPEAREAINNNKNKCRRVRYHPLNIKKANIKKKFATKMRENLAQKRIERLKEEAEKKKVNEDLMDFVKRGIGPLTKKIL